MTENTKAAREKSWSARVLIQNLTEHRGKVLAGADEGFGPDLREPMTRVLDAGAAQVQSLATQVVEADTRALMEGLDDVGPRNRRDTSNDRTRNLLMTLRGGVASYWSEEEAEARGLGAVPEQPDRVLLMAKAVITAFAEKPLPPSPTGVELDNGPVMAQLAEAAGELEQGLKDVDREAAEDQSANLAKHDTFDRFDRMFDLVAGLGSSLLRLAGEDAVADRLRPSRRRRGVTHGVETGLDPLPEPADDAPAADDTPVPAPAAEDDVA